MAIFNEFPNTNFHDLNLDWVIAKVKELSVEWATVNNHFNSIEEEWNSYKTFIDNYFNNLNIQNEINNKMDDLVESGTLGTIIAPFVPDEVSEWLSTHVINWSGVVDDTLSIQGAAADAKATGERIASARNTADLVTNAINLSSLAAYLYKKDCYINDSGIDTTISDYDTYKIPVNLTRYVIVNWGETQFWDALNIKYAVTFESDGVRSQPVPAIQFSYNWIFYPLTKQFLYINDNTVDYIYITIKRDIEEDITLINNSVYMDFYNADHLWNHYITNIDNRTGQEIKAYLRGNENKLIPWINNTIPAYLVMLKKGDRLVFSDLQEGLRIYGSYWDSVNNAVVEISDPEFTAPFDTFATVFNSSSDPNLVLKIPMDQIKIEAGNIVGDITMPGVLQFKKWAAFGDSITQQFLWEPVVLEKLGGECENCGVGSSPVGGDYASAFWQDARLNTIKEYDPDIVTIFGGANDLSLAVPIGTTTDIQNRKTSTFKGAYSYIINNLLTWKPSLKIFIISPTYAHNDGADLSPTLSYKDYAAAAKEISEYFHLPYIDLYNNSGFNEYTMNSAPYNIYSNDRIHPNQNGANIIASIVIQKFVEVLNS